MKADIVGEQYPLFLIHINKENEDHEKRVYYYVILQV